MKGLCRTKVPVADATAAHEIKNAFTIDSRIEQLHQKFELPVGIKEIIGLARELNTNNRHDRVQTVRQFLDIDRSLGLGGYLVNFDSDTFSFYYVRMYGNVYRPIKHVYMDICQTISPATWSQAIAESSCEHVEQCLRVYLHHTGISIDNDPNLRQILEATEGILSIMLLDQLAYCRIKHGFQNETLRDQLLSLAESLIFYFICRKVGIRLLEECGALTDIADEILKGQTHKGVLSNRTVG